MVAARGNGERRAAHTPWAGWPEPHATWARAGGTSSVRLPSGDASTAPAPRSTSKSSRSLPAGAPRATRSTSHVHAAATGAASLQAGRGADPRPIDRERDPGAVRGAIGHDPQRQPPLPHGGSVAGRPCQWNAAGAAVGIGPIPSPTAPDGSSSLPVPPTAGGGGGAAPHAAISADGDAASQRSHADGQRVANGHVARRRGRRSDREGSERMRAATAACVASDLPDGRVDCRRSRQVRCGTSPARPPASG